MFQHQLLLNDLATTSGSLVAEGASTRDIEPKQLEVGSEVFTVSTLDAMESVNTTSNVAWLV